MLCSGEVLLLRMKKACPTGFAFCSFLICLMKWSSSIRKLHMDWGSNALPGHLSLGWVESRSLPCSPALCPGGLSVSVCVGMGVGVRVVACAERRELRCFA